MRIALRSSQDRNQIYEEIGARFSAVFCTDANTAEAVITDYFEEAVAAAKSGKHVLFDAPCELNETACETLASAGTTNSVTIMPGHQWRFVASVAAVNASLEAGNLGEPGLLRIHRWKLESDEKKARAMLMADLDLAGWMFGGDPTALYVVRRPHYIQVHLGFENDGMALITQATARPAHTDYDSLTLIGSVGTAYADDHHNMNIHFSEESSTAILVEQGRSDLVGMLKEFLAAIWESRIPFVTIDDTRRALRAIDRISNSEGRLL